MSGRKITHGRYQPYEGGERGRGLGLGVAVVGAAASFVRQSSGLVARGADAVTGRSRRAARSDDAQLRTGYYRPEDGDEGRVAGAGGEMTRGRAAPTGGSVAAGVVLRAPLRGDLGTAEGDGDDESGAHYSASSQPGTPSRAQQQGIARRRSMSASPLRSKSATSGLLSVARALGKAVSGRLSRRTLSVGDFGVDMQAVYGTFITVHILTPGLT